MKPKAITLCLFGFSLALFVDLYAYPQQESGSAKATAKNHSRGAAKENLRLAGAILVPGNPIRLDIS